MERARCNRDLESLKDLCKTHALGIVRYVAQSDVEETVRVHRAFLVDLARLTPRVPAPLLAKAAKGHAPELTQPERENWANEMKHAMQYCYKNRDVKKLSPPVAAVARALQERGQAPTLPTAPASSTRSPALRSPPSASEIAALYGTTPRTPTKRGSTALDSPSPTSGQTSSTATGRRRLTRKQSFVVDLLTPPAAEKPAPKRTSVREVDYNRMKLKETDDSGELREFDLAPGEKGMCVAILADGTTWTSEITNADFAAWKNPPVNKKPANNNKKPAAAPGAWREDDDLAMDADEEGEGEEEMDTDGEAEGPEEDDDTKFESKWGHVKLGNKFGPFPKPAALMPKPAAAALPKAKPAAADPGKSTDEKGRTFDFKTEQFDHPMYYQKSHSVGLRVKGGSQLISFGGQRCTAAKEYLLEIGRQLKKKLNEGKVGLQEAKEYALSKIIFE